ncbi:LOW QUALITY PROTEIN: vitelline membrane outer layer protein 1 homolog [Manacus candei]|uniref:LOW QUALITY PROTEIN: vitelline membrane outer layer protein 1 homolog n=1 Tax=Manacus candei TaxID=415023 RepID=UPI002225BA36|nr:LOW QUALITY PROTEIN: vitelline membrane outer layer protein 1 homolog [Manacus candei]
MAPSPRPWVALVALLVALVAPPARGWDRNTRTATLSVVNGGSWGFWGHTEFCPRGAFATGLELKIQPYQGFWGDDTGLNGVLLLCQGGERITSTVGPFGSWSRAASCPPGAHLVAFRLEVEAPRGVWDDTAANSLDGLCSDGSHLSPAFSPRGSLGDWSPTCPPAGGVCGIRTRVDQSRDDIDDTGLNDVQLICCPPL